MLVAQQRDGRKQRGVQRLERGFCHARDEADAFGGARKQRWRKRALERQARRKRVFRRGCAVLAGQQQQTRRKIIPASALHIYTLTLRNNTWSAILSRPSTRSRRGAAAIDRGR